MGEHPVYGPLGVRTIVNADTTLTNLGSPRMEPSVVAAMAGAADAYVDLHELALVVGERLAALTGNPAALVTAGAAAGLTLATWACMTGPDAELAERAARAGVGGADRPQVVYQASQENPYLVALRASGAQLIAVGDATGTRSDELASAMQSRPTAVLHDVNADYGHGSISLKDVIALARDAGVPVIVDAAAQLPPAANLRRYTELGADLVLFSGGKGLRGPASAGLAVGDAALIEAMRLHAAPYQRLGRGLKVTKEEMVGMIAAVEWLVGRDEGAERKRIEHTTTWWVTRLNLLPGIRSERAFPGEAGRPTPRARVTFAPGLGLGGLSTRARLLAGDPPVAVAADGEHGILLNAETLADDEQAEVVFSAVAALVSDRRQTA